ncbi:MAG: hypothetical protein JRJ44_02315 [Deltaproteobacteria bacterium]|nr:hypothetical protein [Deltaproteobacteria bacterium]
MSKTANIRAIIEPELKLGRGIPFPIKIPKKKIKQVFNDTNSSLNINKYKNTKKLFDQLGI